MPPVKARRALPPLNRKQLHELALSYVGRYATTRAKLCAYLSRKIRERGWDDAQPPELEALARRFAELGYVDDSAFALGKSQALAARGYGKRRLMQKLYAAGVAGEDGEAALDHADQQAIAAALRFAERRKIGPFAAAEITGRPERERAVAAMVRAGHHAELARAIVSLAPGSDLDIEELACRARRTNV